MTAAGEDERPPGWYQDPYARRPYRWWDGERWTAYAGAEQVDWDPPPEERRAVIEAPRGLGVAAAGFIVGVAASIAAVASLPDDASTATEMAVSSLTLWTVLVLAWLLVRRRAGDGSIGFRFRWSDVGFGLAGSLVARVLAGVAISPIPFPDQRLRDLEDAGDALSGAAPWIVLVLVTCVGAPLVEEVFFRGVVQRRLVTRLGPVAGIAVASVLFGAAHLIGWEGPLSLATAWAIAASGAVLGVLYHLTGRLGTSIAAHAWFNAQVMVLLALFGT